MNDGDSPDQSNAPRIDALPGIVAEYGLKTEAAESINVVSLKPSTGRVITDERGETRVQVSFDWDPDQFIEFTTKFYNANDRVLSNRCLMTVPRTGRRHVLNLYIRVPYKGNFVLVITENRISVEGWRTGSVIANVLIKCTKLFPGRKLEPFPKLPLDFLPPNRLQLKIRTILPSHDNTEFRTVLPWAVTDQNGYIFFAFDHPQRVIFRATNPDPSGGIVISNGAKQSSIFVRITQKAACKQREFVLTVFGALANASSYPAVFNCLIHVAENMVNLRRDRPFPACPLNNWGIVSPDYESYGMDETKFCHSIPLSQHLFGRRPANYGSWGDEMPCRVHAGSNDFELRFSFRKPVRLKTELKLLDVCDITEEQARLLDNYCLVQKQDLAEAAIRVRTPHVGSYALTVHAAAFGSHAVKPLFIVLIVATAACATKPFPTSYDRWMMCLHMLHGPLGPKLRMLENKIRLTVADLDSASDGAVSKNVSKNKEQELSTAFVSKKPFHEVFLLVDGTEQIPGRTGDGMEFEFVYAPQPEHRTAAIAIVAEQGLENVIALSWDISGAIQDSTDSLPAIDDDVQSPEDKTPTIVTSYGLLSKDAEGVDVVSLTPEDGKLFTDKYGEAKVQVVLNIASGEFIEFQQCMYDANNDTLPNRTIAMIQRTQHRLELTIRLRVPSNGFYALVVFENHDEHSESSAAFASVLVRCESMADGATAPAFPNVPANLLGVVPPNPLNLSLTATLPAEENVDQQPGWAWADAKGDVMFVFEHPERITFVKPKLASCGIVVTNDVSRSTLLIRIPAFVARNRREFLVKVHGGLANSASFGHVFTSVIKVPSRLFALGFMAPAIKPLPECPLNNWGIVGADYGSYGLQETKYVNSVPLSQHLFGTGPHNCLSDGDTLPCRAYKGGDDFELHLTLRFPITLKASLKSGDDRWCSEDDAKLLDTYCLVQTQETAEAVILARLPQPGGYALAVQGGRYGRANMQTLLVVMVVATQAAMTVARPFPTTFSRWNASVHVLRDPLCSELIRKRGNKIRLRLARLDGTRRRAYGEVFALINRAIPVRGQTTDGMEYEFDVAPGRWDDDVVVVAREEKGNAKFSLVLQFDLVTKL